MEITEILHVRFSLKFLGSSTILIYEKIEVGRSQ
jgi:hypothetical protein